MKEFLVAYDIRNPRRLVKVARIMEGYGLRIQKSVFQCSLEKEEITRMRLKLLAVIHKKRDSLMFVPICPRCRSIAINLGQKKLLEIKEFLVL